MSFSLLLMAFFQEDNKVCLNSYFSLYRLRGTIQSTMILPLTLKDAMGDITVLWPEDGLLIHMGNTSKSQNSLLSLRLCSLKGGIVILGLL